MQLRVRICPPKAQPWAPTCSLLAGTERQPWGPAVVPWMTEQPSPAPWHRRIPGSSRAARSNQAAPARRCRGRGRGGRRTCRSASGEGGTERVTSSPVTLMDFDPPLGPAHLHFGVGDGVAQVRLVLVDVLEARIGGTVQNHLGMRRVEASDPCGPPTPDPHTGTQHSPSP